MLGVYNSEIEHKELSTHDPECLGSMMVNVFVNDFKFDPEAERFQDITPRQLAEKLNEVAHKLEADIQAAYESAGEAIHAAFPSLKGPK